MLTMPDYWTLWQALLGRRHHGNGLQSPASFTRFTMATLHGGNPWGGGGGAGGTRSASTGWLKKGISLLSPRPSVASAGRPL